jgi:carboxyl-terminal processing protease
MKSAPQTRRSGIFVPLVIVLGALVGGFYGPALERTSAASNAAGDLPDSLRSFTALYSLVESNFADPLPPERALYQGAIPGMLQTLDPHSSFLDPAAFAQMQQEQRGQYFGVGMLIGMDGPRVTVMEPFPASPAKLAGLRRGDVLVAVDGRSTEGMDTSRVADLLKGPRGTQVKVSVRREGASEPVSYQVSRGEILPTNVLSFWLKPGVAYLQIRSFDVQTTSHQVEQEFQRLGESQINGLILDLRGNRGGLVSEAVNIAGRFLQKGQTVVSHRGRASAEQIFRARNGSSERRYPIVVLVDRGSASAAEIVAGALQDHDRAWVLGETTFGKGLVQAQFPLSEGALLLTIARYYTPSGRLIQRDYAQKSFFDYYYQRDPDAKNPLDVKMTDAGRTVYGGGGIAPDEKYTTPRRNSFQIRVLGTNSLFHFASIYFGPNKPELPEGWKPDEAVMKRFREHLAKEPAPFTDDEFNQNREWVAQQLRLEMYFRAFDKAHADELAFQTDPEVQKAVVSLPIARSLLDQVQRVMAKRAA